MNNQEIKRDEGKLRLTLVPLEIIRNIASIRMFGLKKYKEKESWKSVEVERYRDAMFRHMLLYLENPHGLDEESGLPHLWHLACNVAFLCELEKGKFDDNKLDLSQFNQVKLKDEKQDIIELVEAYKKAVKNYKATVTTDVDGFDWEKGDYVNEKENK